MRGPASNAPIHEGSQAQPGFDAFYDTEWSELVRLAWAFTGRMDVAEDLVREALLLAHQQWDRVVAHHVPKAWVRQALFNRCMSRRRRFDAEIRSLLRLGRRRRSEPVIEAWEGDVWYGVRRLPPRQRQLILLVYLEDRTPSQAASILGIGEATASTQLRRALVKLSDIFWGAVP